MSPGNRLRILITLAVFLSAISLTFVSRVAEAAFIPQGAQAERTFKNIQVLKGLREGELYQTMNFIAVSLGENCTFCHVTNGRDPKTNQINWVWESDDKPEKQTARRMLQMVLLINGSNKVDFGPNAVTCHTCHRGQRTPEALPSMPLAKSGHEGLLYPAPIGVAAPSPRPAVEEILAHYVQAIGGPKAAATTTLVMKGTRVASQNRNWPNEITWSAPDKLLSVMTLPQTTIRQAAAGDTGWVLNGTKLQTLTATQSATARRGLEEVVSAVKVTQVPGMQSAGMEKIEGREMWLVVRSTPETTLKYYFDELCPKSRTSGLDTVSTGSGSDLVSDQHAIFPMNLDSRRLTRSLPLPVLTVSKNDFGLLRQSDFDAETGLLRRRLAINHAAVLPIPEQLDFEDYRDVDGVKLPFIIRRSAIDTYDSWTRTFTEIKRNVAVNDTLFAAPVVQP